MVTLDLAINLWRNQKAYFAEVLSKVSLYFHKSLCIIHDSRHDMLINGIDLSLPYFLPNHSFLGINFILYPFVLQL